MKMSFSSAQIKVANGRIAELQRISHLREERLVALASNDTDLADNLLSTIDALQAEYDAQPDRAEILADAQKKQRQADKHTAERILNSKRDADGVTVSMFEDFTPTDEAGNRSLF